MLIAGKAYLRWIAVAVFFIQLVVMLRDDQMWKGHVGMLALTLNR
jgi:hypothetical protein